MEIPEALLRSLNEQYRREEIPPRQRPLRAMADISKQLNCSLCLPSPEMDRIFEWFEKNTKPGAHQIGPMFTGAFFFDTSFWPLTIPWTWGIHKLDALDSLGTMPQQLKDDLQKHEQDLWIFALYWADCLDYAFGFKEALTKDGFETRAALFLRNGDSDLRGAISQLLAARPNPKATHSLRLSCEIFLKACLIQEQKLSDDELKKYGHRIPELARACNRLVPLPEFEVIEKLSGLFPEVSERYAGRERSMSEAWEAMCVAQTTASAIVRHYSGRDSRPQLRSKQ